jgi:O-antigen/teichoic acid export membrane protein
MTKSLTDRTLQGFFWLSSGQWGVAVFQMLVLIILARLLTPADFGLVSAALVVVGFALIFCKMGMGPAVVRLPELTGLHVRVGFTCSVVFGLVAGLFVALTAPLLAVLFRMPELTPVVLLLSVVFPILGISIIPDALLQREMQFRKLAVIDFVSYLLGYAGVGVGLALAGFGVWSLVWAQIGQSFVHTCISLLMKRREIGFSWRREEARALVGFGAGFSVGNIATFLANRADYFVVGRGLGADALGLYSRAYQLLVIPTQLFGSVGDRVLFPAMASVQHDRARLARSYLRSMGVVALVTWPVTALLIVMGPEIISILLGAQWGAVVLPFQLLALMVVFRTGYKISDSLARATGALYRYAWRQWLYAGAVFLGATLGLRWGIEGAAIGVVVAILMNYLFMYHLSVQLTGVNWRQLGAIHLRHGAVALVVAAGAAGSRMALSAFRPHEIVNLAVGLLGGGLVLVLLWFCLPRLFGDEGGWMGSLIRRYGRTAGARLGLCAPVEA